MIRARDRVLEIAQHDVDPSKLGMGGGINPYVYVGNNPVTRIDPNGQAFFTAALGIVAGGVSGYETGGLTGSIVGASVGAFVGFFDPYHAAAAGELATITLQNVGRSVALNAGSAATGTALTNAINSRSLLDGVGYAATIGGLAPLASGEAIALGATAAGKSIAPGLGTAGQNTLQSLTALFGIAGANTSQANQPSTCNASRGK